MDCIVHGITKSRTQLNVFHSLRETSSNVLSILKGATSRAELPMCLCGKESACQCSRSRGFGSIPGSGRSPRVGNATCSTMLAWKIHGQKGLMRYSPWACKELDVTEHACTSRAISALVKKSVEFSIFKVLFFTLISIPEYKYLSV